MTIKKTYFNLFSLKKKKSNSNYNSFTFYGSMLTMSMIHVSSTNTAWLMHAWHQSIHPSRNFQIIPGILIWHDYPDMDRQLCSEAGQFLGITGLIRWSEYILDWNMIRGWKQIDLVSRRGPAPCMARAGELSQICEGAGLWKGNYGNFSQDSGSNHASKWREVRSEIAHVLRYRALRRKGMGFECRS